MVEDILENILKILKVVLWKKRNRLRRNSSDWWCPHEQKSIVIYRLPTNRKSVHFESFTIRVFSMIELITLDGYLL